MAVTAVVFAVVFDQASNQPTIQPSTKKTDWNCLFFFSINVVVHLWCRRNLRGRFDTTGLLRVSRRNIVVMSSSTLADMSSWRVDDPRFDDEISYVREAETKRIPLRISGTQRKQVRGKPAVVFYVIKSKTADVVERRFSDFVWLRDVFKALYVGMQLPPMPKKEIIATEAVIEQRQAGLEAFLKAVLRNPYLRTDAVLRQFLRSEAEAFAAIRKRAPLAVSMTEAFQSAGARRWNLLVSSFKLDKSKPTVPTLTALREEAIRLQHVTTIAADASEEMIPNLVENERLWRRICGLLKEDNALCNRK